MSRTNYYYASSKSLECIAKPGILCDYCGELALIEKAEGSTMIPMPITPLDEEYGHEEGNIHAHPKCALRAYKEMKNTLRQLERELKKRKLL